MKKIFFVPVLLLISSCNSAISVSQEGKNICIARSSTEANAFSAKIIYQECLKTIENELSKERELQLKIQKENQQKELEQKKLVDEACKNKYYSFFRKFYGIDLEKISLSHINDDEFQEKLKGKEINNIFIYPDYSYVQVIKKDGIRYGYDMTLSKIRKENMIELLIENDVAISIIPSTKSFVYYGQKGLCPFLPISISSYSKVIEEIDSGEIEYIYVAPKRREVEVSYKNGKRKIFSIMYNDNLILQKAIDNKVNMTILNN